MAQKLHFNKVAIIGVGLIGGSLAMVLKERRLASKVTGIGRGMKNLETALRLGVVDSVTQDVAEGVQGADLVVVAVPVLKVTEAVKKALPHLKKPCIVTDVGSVKKGIIDEIEPMLPPGISFVPAHPIAGTEYSGVEAAFPHLFKDRVCVITPSGKTDKESLEKIKALWEEAGGKVVTMDAETHDRVFAAVSHLPHMVAYTLVNTVADEGAEMVGFSAGGFKDFTRIASSSPEMWTDICAMNRPAIVKMMENFQKRFERLKTLIAKGDMERIKEDFERAKSVRDSLVVKKS